ncbi:MAG: T9SS type A sorting domain-containing protein [Flavobacteriales bacterium]|nr:T9SS type A sorting domain-containing protein [Flavobacteriales bacterium]
MTIETGSVKPCQAEVLNLLGEVVHTARFQGRTSLDLSDLSKGVYTLRVLEGDVSRTERLVIR